MRNDDGRPGRCTECIIECLHHFHNLWDFGFLNSPPFVTCNGFGVLARSAFSKLTTNYGKWILKAERIGTCALSSLHLTSEHTGTSHFNGSQCSRRRRHCCRIHSPIRPNRNHSRSRPCVCVLCRTRRWQMMAMPASHAQLHTHEKKERSKRTDST